MSTLTKNTTELQTILELVNGLPEAGGGGLPEGITAIATGVYTPTSKKTASVNVEHNLGAKPDFCCWMLENDASAAPLASTTITGYLIEKPAVYSNSIATVYNTHLSASAYNSSGSLQRTAQSLEASSHTDTTCCIWANSQYCLATGYSYRWVCGVIDSIE